MGGLATNAAVRALLPKKLIEKTLAQYDADGDGFLDKAEWKAVLLALVKTPGKKEWEAIAACEGGDAETVRITLFSVLNSLFFRLSSPTLLGRIWYVELGLNTLLVGFGLPRRAAED